MRKIDAIIRKSKFKHVKSALLENGFSYFNYHLTRSSVLAEHRYYRGVEYDAQAEERIKLTIFVNSNKVKQVLEIIQSSGLTKDANESFIAVFKPETIYQLIDDNGKDKLIEKM